MKLTKEQTIFLVSVWATCGIVACYIRDGSILFAALLATCVTIS